MNASSQQHVDDPQFWDLMEHAHNTMERIEQHIDEHNQAGLKRRELTNLLVRIITIFLVLLVIVNLFLLKDLDSSMRGIVQSMDQMTGHFAAVSQEMLNVTEQTARIAAHMDSLPAVEYSLAGINGDMLYMDRSIDLIGLDLTTVNGHLGAVDGSMGELNSRLYQLSQNVHIIRYDMHSISKPARWMNKFMP